MKKIFVAVLLLLLMPIGGNAANITFGWDYSQEGIDRVVEFRMYKKLCTDAEYPATAWAKIPKTADSTTANGLLTWQKPLELVLPDNTKGELCFVMTAADAENESGYSNEVTYAFDTTPLDAPLRYQILVNVTGVNVVQ